MAVDGVGTPIVDGQVTNRPEPKPKDASGNAMDKDAFLKLLVAQMKYQDPLQPTSNTEYISQFATFSELEQMQNMSSTLELSRASSYVGQTVIVHTENSVGETVEIEGRVDYVTYENNKAMLSINGGLYEVGDVYATVDPEYKAASDLAVAFAEGMNGLPDLETVTLEDEETIAVLQQIYAGMSIYERSFIPDEMANDLNDYIKRILELKPAEETEDGDTEETEGTDESDTDVDAGQDAAVE